MSKKAVVAIGIVVVAIPLLLLAFLLFVFDPNQFRPRIQSQLQEALHRPVSLGSMDLKIFPLQLRIADILIGQPEGYAPVRPFLQAREAFVSVSLLPLLSGNVNIDSVRLDAPQLELIRNATGKWNYETDSSADTSSTSGAGGFALNELQIEDGLVGVVSQNVNQGVNQGVNQAVNQSPARDVYQHINVLLKNVGANRRGSITGSVRLETMAAALKIQSDFDTSEPVSAKGTLTLASDKNTDPLDVAFDVRRPANAPLSINSLTAKIGKLAATAAGSIDIGKTPPSLQLRVQTSNAALADLTRLAALYGAEFPVGLQVDGALNADVQITGTTENPLLAGKIEATKAQITAKELAEPVRASALQIDFTPEVLTTKPFVIETGATRLTAQATVSNYSNAATRKVQATVSTNGARIEELLRMATVYGVKPAGLNGSGTLNVDMQVTSAGSAFRYSGTGALREVSLTSPQLPKPLSIAAADLKFAEDRVGVERLRAALGAMHMDGAVSVRNFSRPDIQFNAHIDQLDIAELQKDFGSSPSSKPDPKKNSLNDITAAGNLNVDKIISEKITLSNVKSTVKLANGIVRLDPVMAVVFDGQESGSIVADLRNPSAIYTVKSKLANADSNQLLSAVSSLKNVLIGRLTSNLDIQFAVRPNEDIAKSLTGKMSLQMGQGRLSGVPVLNEIANIAQFIGYRKKTDTGTTINKLTGSLNIQNGLATTDDLFLDMGEGTLSGAGNINLVDQTLRLRVTTVLGKLFSQNSAPGGKIGGLLTTVMANNQGELVVPAIISGTFANPKFAPDAEQMGKMKLKGLLPTANNPGALTSGVRGIVGAITGKPQDAAEPGAAQTPAAGIVDLFNQFKKKKPAK